MALIENTGYESTAKGVREGSEPVRNDASPHACAECGGQLFWEPVYDQRLWCLDCDPWPSESIVRQLWGAILAEPLWHVLTPRMELVGTSDEFGGQIASVKASGPTSGRSGLDLDALWRSFEVGREIATTDLKPKVHSGRRS